MLVLRSEIAALNTAETQLRDKIDDLNSSLKDLEEILLRELIEDTPRPELNGKTSRKTKSAKATNTRKGDFSAVKAATSGSRHLTAIRQKKNKPHLQWNRLLSLSLGAPRYLV
jgi:hypothetical protein